LRFTSHASFSVKKPFFLFLAALALGSCKKNDNSPASPTKTDLLTAKNWRVSAVTHTTIVNGQLVVTDAYAAYPACDRDDFYKFNLNNLVVRDQGSFKCDASASQTLAGPWSFSDDQTQLNYLPLGYATSPGDIIELSASTLHVRFGPSEYYNVGSAPTPTVDVIYTAF
jgi:hypothetical protein